MPSDFFLIGLFNHIFLFRYDTHILSGASSNIKTANERALSHVIFEYYVRLLQITMKLVIVG